MAGRGKGALRIALEDFLESFTWGKIFSKWFGEFGDEQEAAIGEYYDILIQELPDGMIKDLIRGWSKRQPGDKAAQEQGDRPGDQGEGYRQHPPLPAVRPEIRGESTHDRRSVR